MSTEKDNIITFQPIPLWLRIFSLIFAILIFISNIMGMKKNNYSVISLVLGSIFFMASLYENRWKFNLKEKKIIHKKGLLFLHKTKCYNFSEIENILVNEFYRTGKKASYTEILIQYKDGIYEVIESDKTKKMHEKILITKEIQKHI